MNTYVTKKNFERPKKAERISAEHRDVKGYAALPKITLWSLTLALCGYLLIYPSVAKSAVHSALTLCLASLLPSLFPFMIAGEILTVSGFPDIAERYLGKAFERLFKINGKGASAFVIGAFCGYPVGAKTAISLYLSGDIEREDAEALCGLCNNAGIGFVISGVGAEIWHSTRFGALLYLSQLISAILTGALLFGMREGLKNTERKSPVSPKAPTDTSVSEALSGAVTSSVTAILRVMGFVIFFKILISVLNTVFLASGTDPLAVSLISALTEITAGASSLHMLSSVPHLTKAAKLLTFSAVSFGGLSVYMQVCALAYPAKLRMGRYLKTKLIQSALCTLIGAAPVLLGAV